MDWDRDYLLLLNYANRIAYRFKVKIDGCDILHKVIEQGLRLWGEDRMNTRYIRKRIWYECHTVRRKEKREHDILKLATQIYLERTGKDDE